MPAEHAVHYVLEDRKAMYESFLVSAEQLLTVSPMLLGSWIISEPICPSVWLLVQLQSRVKHICEGAKDAS